MQPIAKVRRLLPAVMAVLICFVTPRPGQPAQDQLAVVNDVPITRQDVIQEAAVIAADIQLRNLMWTKEQITGLNNQILGTLIDRELLYQRARLRDIEIRSQWIERALMELKAKIGNAAAFDAYLKSIDLSEEQLRERIQKGLIVKRLLHREVIRQIKVSEAEMQTFFGRHPEFFIHKDQARVRQIFVAFPKTDDVSARGDALLRIQSIQDRLRQGIDFAALALEYSEDPSKARGGDLGYLERTQMIPSFAEAAFALQPGEISDIVESRIGYHLIKMVDRSPSSQMAYRNARTKIERTLRRNKEKSAAADYLAKLKSQATIIR
jgi:peptidyl-prolyl cis-trans isomerase C